MNLTKEDILKMDAGRELDLLIAQHVLDESHPTLEEMKEIAEEQWKVQPGCFDFFRNFSAWKELGEFKYERRAERYSTDIEKAWKVVGKMKAFGWSFSLTVWGDDENIESKFKATFGFDAEGCSAEEETAQLAICKAALLAILKLTDGESLFSQAQKISDHIRHLSTE